MYAIIYIGILRLLYPIAVILTVPLLIVKLGTPAGAQEINENLWRIGLTNHAGEAPLLLRRYEDTDNGITVMEFAPNGIPRTDWEDKLESIQTALNVCVLKIEEGKNKRRIIVHMLSGDRKLPKIIYWQKEYFKRHRL